MKASLRGRRGLWPLPWAGLLRLRLVRGAVFNGRAFDAVCLFQRNRPGVAPARGFDKRFDAFIDRWVRREQVGKARMRIVETHFHDRRSRAAQFAAIFDLAKRHDHGIGIFGELYCARVGQVFA